MKHEDERTSLIRKLLHKRKPLSYIRERYSEEFNENLTLIHIYNVLRSIAQEQCIENRSTDLVENQFFPDLRFVLKHEPTSEIIEEEKSQNWRVLLNSKNKFLIYFGNSFVGETDFGVSIVDFKLHNDYLVVLTHDSLCSIYLPSFKIITHLPFGSDKPHSIDSSYFYFHEFRQKYILDEFGEIKLGIVEKGRFESKREIAEVTNENDIVKENLCMPDIEIEKLKMIEIVYLEDDGSIYKVEISFEPVKKPMSRKIFRKFVDSSDRKNVRFVYENNSYDVKLFTGLSDVLIDSTKRENLRIKDGETVLLLNKILADAHSKTSVVFNKSAELIFTDGVISSNQPDSTLVYDRKLNKKILIHQRFYSVYEVDSTYFILTSSPSNLGFCIYVWNGSFQTPPKLLHQTEDILAHYQKIISADLHVQVEIKRKNNIQEDKSNKVIKEQQNISPRQIRITQVYTEVEYLRLIRDILLIASKDRLLKAWTLEGEYLGVVAEVGDFSELRNFVKPNERASGYVIDDTVVFIGDTWISGSKGYSDHIHVCFGGIPEFHFKEQILKVYSTDLSDAYYKLVGDKVDVPEGRKN